MHGILIMSSLAAELGIDMVIAVKIKTDVLQVALHQAGRTWPSAMPSAKNNDAPFKGLH